MSKVIVNGEFEFELESVAQYDYILGYYRGKVFGNEKLLTLEIKSKEFKKGLKKGIEDSKCDKA